MEKMCVEQAIAHVSAFEKVVRKPEQQVTLCGPTHGLILAGIRCVKKGAW
jgi:hypothetical protein